MVQIVTETEKKCSSSVPLLDYISFVQKPGQVKLSKLLLKIRISNEVILFLGDPNFKNPTTAFKFKLSDPTSIKKSQELKKRTSHARERI